MMQLELPFDRPITKRLDLSSVHVYEFRDKWQIADMLQLTERFAAECDPDEVYDEMCARLTMQSMLDVVSRQYTNCFIAYRDGKAVGFLLASISHSLYSASKSARQDLWYVLPRYRGGFATLKLLHAFEYWACDRGATKLVTGSTNVANIRLAEKTASTLTRLGYARVGSVHIKDVANG